MMLAQVKTMTQGERLQAMEELWDMLHLEPLSEYYTSDV